MTDEPNLVLRVLEQIRDEARATNARLDQTNARLDLKIARLDNHERILLRVAEELGAIHGTLERIDGRVVRLEAGQELTNERLEHLEAGQELTNERLEHLDAGQSRVEQQLGALVGLTGQIADRQLSGDAALDDLRRRVEQLERKVG
jgi:chromosome segregation ATPase